MTLKEWAARLNGRQYTKEVSCAEEIQAKDDGVIVVFGASDDLMEFRGALRDEVSAYKGVTVRLTPDFKLFDCDENMDTLKYNAAEIESMPNITAVWLPENEHGEPKALWLYKTDIPHEQFEILDDDCVYCYGIVFNAFRGAV